MMMLLLTTTTICNRFPVHELAIALNKVDKECQWLSTVVLVAYI